MELLHLHTMRFEKSSMPVSVLFLIDLGICFISVLISYLLRFNFNIPAEEFNSLFWVIPSLLAIRTISNLIFQTHRGIIRLTNTSDVQRVFLSVACGSIFIMLFNPILLRICGTYLIPYSITVIECVFTIFLMVTMRIGVKVLLIEWFSTGKEKSKVVIVGSGDTGLTAKRAIERDAGAKYVVVAFIDDDPGRRGKKVQGVHVKQQTELFEMINDQEIQLVILARTDIEADQKQNIIDSCLVNNIKVFSVPPVSSWINGELSFKQIKKINVKDLLERSIIDIHTENIRKELQGKRVLVTGAAGSIGSEMVKQILPFKPSKLILLDQAESPLYELERELQDELNYSGFEIVVGDIRNEARMRNVFQHFQPEYVFHAAAYKHVPLMENNPSEALLTNVKGTRVLADLASEFGAQKFVMVSTDKAVRPTNVMGASKRVAEIYVQSLGQVSQTKFITTRFGNVLGSNGSVIPIFARQIERGGPVTVTHPDVTRFFMTIPEACLLVLEAGTYGQGGEIFLFDMGKSVRIKDLVEKMIKLSGLTLNKDITIKYTGLRPGEKLYEELLNDKENTVETHHKRIMKALVQEFDFKMVEQAINEMIPFFETQNNEEIVKRMKLLVPEYKSKNSIFEQLDQDPTNTI